MAFTPPGFYGVPTNYQPATPADSPPIPEAYLELGEE